MDTQKTLYIIYSTNLRTDSTNTLNAFTWIQAQKHSLKFTFSHLTNGPCKEAFTLNPNSTLSVSHYTGGPGCSLKSLISRQPHFLLKSQV